MTTMQRIRLVMSILVLLGLVSRGAADDIPKRFNFDRYQSMLNRSPFAVATAVAAPAATPDFAKDLYVANAARSPDGDMVTIGSTGDKNFKKYLSTKGTVDGFGIASIEWSDRVGATKVTISKDGKFATLTFNEALLTQPLPNAPPAPPPPAPGGVLPGVKPAPIPNLPTSQPRVRGVIQRNPSATPVPIVPSTPTPEL
jgi:hypothetical protein